MSSEYSSPPGAGSSARTDRPAEGRSAVVALNEESALYLALAEGIRGAAVGLSPAAQRLLRRGLVERFGPLFADRGEKAVDELLRLANEPQAA